MFQRNTLNRLIQIILILKILKWIYSTKSLEKENLNEITPKLIPYLNFHEKKRKNINCSWNYSSNNFNIAINIESVMGLIP
mgnify:CR=1 FL=1